MFHKVLITLALTILSCFVSLAQTPSGVSYPVAECNGGTCPGYPTVKSHITCSYVDTLTETLYTAGQFRTLGGQTRIGIGAIDAANGTLLPFAPVIDTFGCIYAMGIKGDTLFVGGHFTKVNGVARNNFAAIRISTGALLASFNTGIGGVGDTVFAITVYSGRIYIGGKFTTVFGQSRTSIARVNYDGTVNAWNPVTGGIVRKTMQWQNRILAIADVGALDSRLIRIDTSGTTVFQLTSTQNSASGRQIIQDFVTRSDSVYAVGAIYEIESGFYDGMFVTSITTGSERTWGITIPFTGISANNRARIEFYRDSLYITTFDALTQVQPQHALYAASYRGNSLRTMKVYNSNAIGLNGWYAQDILIGNARLIEIERYAQHTAFPNGSVQCNIWSWCMKIPALCGNWIGNPYSVCPGDTVWISVAPEFYYATYNWNVGFGNITLIPNGDSCGVIAAANFTGGQVTVRGVTSCGTQNSSARTILISALTLPAVSAGADDSLSCIITQIVLHGSCSPAPVSWVWTGPNAFSSVDTCIVNTTGTFYLTCTGSNGCSSTDSATVFPDTIPPAIVRCGATPTLTCEIDPVVLDASPLYPNDSLRWFVGAGSFPNPAFAVAPGNVLLEITDRNNGCSSTDTIVVALNNTPPNGSASYSDTTLTCAVDSILLAGNASTGVAYYWRDTSVANTFPDPLWVTTPGPYVLVATNLANGCTLTIGPIFVLSWYTPPNITIQVDSFNINCSYDSVLLSGSSLTLAATLNWTDSVAFNATNPAMTGAQGWYYLVATDTLNGCVAVDSAYVGFDSTLVVVGVNDTVICPGSGAVLNVSPIGGTPAFSYQWNNSGGNAALVTVYPSDTLQYTVTVTDANGCVGVDSVVVGVPDPMLDSTLSFQPCDPLQPTGQIQIYPWGGVPPYQFSNDNGLTWQTNGVFGGLTYGSYQFLVQDALGCQRTTNGIIDTNSLSPAPEFLVSTSPDLGDTIVIVDISNPRPDSVVWVFPASAIIVDTSMFAPALIPGDTGAFTISMHAFYGTCEVVLTRLINIQPFDSLNANPWTMNAIDSLILYPNPNNGVFTVHTELEGKQDFVIMVTDELGNERARQQVYDSDAWTGQMSVSNPVPGNYILRVIAEFDSAEVIFVISQ